MEQLQKLKEIKGDHTSLVTFVVSGGSAFCKSISMVNHEIATATNIKSRV